MHVWDRWDHIWHWLFLGTLGVSTAVMLADRELESADRLVTLAVAAAFAGWYWLLVMRRREAWERRGPMALYAVGGLGFFVALLARSDVYSVLVYALIPQLFVIFGLRDGILAVGALNVAALLVGGEPGDMSGSAWVDLAVSVALSMVVGAFIHAIAQQSAERAVLLEQNRRLLARARDAGVLEERQRLAREMHDTVAQALTSIVMQLETADAALKDGRQARAGERIDRARQTARSALDELRRAVHALRPAPLEAAPLPDALRRVVERWSAECGVQAQLQVTGTVAELHPDVDVTLLRGAQEGLANVRRHADSTAVTLTLSYMGNGAVLDVHDDGRGFDVATTRGDSLGLKGLRERAEALGGSLGIESSGDGTTLSIVVPALRTAAGPEGGVTGKAGPGASAAARERLVGS